MWCSREGWPTALCKVSDQVFELSPPTDPPLNWGSQTVQTLVPSSMTAVWKNMAHQPLAACLLNFLLGQMTQVIRRVTTIHFGHGSCMWHEEETCHGSTLQLGSFRNTSLSSNEQVMDQVPSNIWSQHMFWVNDHEHLLYPTCRSPSCKPDLWQCSPSLMLFTEPHPSPPW